MFCSQCGAPMGDNDKFCGSCGAPNVAAGASGADAGFTTPQPPVPQRPAPEPKGCVAQAFHDMTKLPGVFRRVCQIAFLPALIGIVSVVLLFVPVVGGILCAIGLLLAYIAGVCGSGYGIEWGRDLSMGAEDGMERPLLRSTSFGIGIFSSVISNVLNFVAAIPVIGVVLSLVEGVAVGAAGSYYFGGYSALGSALLGSFGLLVLCLIVAFVLGIFFKMFGDIAVMHFAVVGRIESAFSLDKVWTAFKHDKTKLFCASFLPEFLCGLVSNAIIWILTAVFGGIAASMVYSVSSFYGYGYSYHRPSGLEAILSSGGLTLVVYLVLVVFVAVFLGVFGTMLKYRAVGYWVARYAPEWADEDEDDVLTFVLPGEKKPVAGAAAPASGQASASEPTASAPTEDAASAAAPAPEPVKAPEPDPAPTEVPDSVSGAAPDSAFSATEASDTTVPESASEPQNPASSAAETTVLPEIDPNDENPFDE